MLVPQANQALIELTQLPVPATPVPLEGTAVLRVVFAFDAYLIAVVDAGNARIGHLEQHTLTYEQRVVLAARRETVGVVTAEHIQHPVGRFGRTGVAEGAQTVVQLR